MRPKLFPCAFREWIFPQAEGQGSAHRGETLGGKGEVSSTFYIYAGCTSPPSCNFRRWAEMPSSLPHPKGSFKGLTL